MHILYFDFVQHRARHSLKILPSYPLTLAIVVVVVALAVEAVGVAVVMPVLKLL
jgi:hypothetical protein